MHAAASAQQWSEVLLQADALARLSPSDRLAARMKRKAWEQVGLSLTQTHRPDSGVTPLHHSAYPLAHDAMALAPESMQGDSSANRRMLWIDAVGGYQLLLDSEILIGQPPGADAAGQGPPGLQILADISRRHAVLRREAGAYVLEPLSEVKIDGRTLTGPTTLSGDCVVTLGPVRLRIARPHALSATVRVTIESGHRTVPAADGVLLLGESCVLGPKPHSHIRCPGWRNELIVYRQGDRLCCRSGSELSVDGRPTSGPAELSAGTRIEGQDFALSIE
ncbi:FHA domain-containing protein [Pirellulimonas nuda]|nr:FHA domain-containing protein [Pirellulimonas nuda]